MRKYDPKNIETKWQKYWEKKKTFRVKEDPKKQKFYGLIEFPYPSGAGLHVGHPRSYTAMDVIARKKRMEGLNVLYPIGFDSFGLPTENFAIKTGRPPKEITDENIATFTRQLKALGFSFDWSRAVTTSEPEYYKWTQWIFLQLYKHGLAYKKKQPINWCPKDKIGLANEEVVDGKCERCGGPVEKRDKEQWMLAITKYADKLLDGLKDVDYIERAKLQQENWIGRSEGAEVVYKLRRIPGQEDDKHSLTIFTTRPDTMFGATFVAISPELAKKWLGVGWLAPENVKAYIEQTLQERMKTDREEQEKTGIDAGFVAVNPANGEEIPVWVANYVMGDVGTGAIMAVPAHDERDFEFAKKFGLPVKPVIVEKIMPTKDQNETLETYENTVEAYVENSAQEVKGHWKEWIDYTLSLIENKNAKIIEFGSGTGRDSDYIESQGYQVERTDVPQSFIEYQKQRGKTVNKFDLLKDVTSYGVYDLAFAHAVLHHFTLEQLPAIFQKILWGLKPNGLFVFSVKEGDGEEIENKKLKKNRYFQYWKKEDVKKLADMVGAEIVDVRSATGTNFPEWLLVTLRKKKESSLVLQGEMVNSLFLDGIQSEAAKEKMISWLEEKGIGKKKVQYKLRDWVFSRQRYWGEPIPLVHCDTCATKKQKVLLIHGFTGRADKNWFPWMKQELERRGFEVFTPTMTTTDHPVLEKWMEELKPFVDQMGEDDIMVGHSLGGKAALHILEQTKKKIGHVYLIAPVVIPLTEEKKGEKILRKPHKDYHTAQAFWNEPLHWKKIGATTSKVNVIFSDNDPSVPLVGHDVLPENWAIQILSGYEHFTDTIIPILLERILESKNTGWIPLPEKELPLKLPEVKNYQPTDTGESPLAAMTDWVNTTCPKCGGPATRETDTMPNWAGSSWYFLRYCDPKNKKELASKEKLEYWMGPALPKLPGSVGGVDWYNGGMEHTVLHLLYSRFWNQFLHDIGVVPTSEPYQKRTSHGIILASDGEKMSKSRGNVVNPDDMVAEYGADALRTYIMFMGPFDQAIAWDTNGLVGVRRFLERVWFLQSKINEQSTMNNTNVERLLHQTIKKVTEDIEGMRFNTAIAKLMELTNELNKEESISSDVYSTLVQLLSPFAPHLAEEIWFELGHKDSIAFAEWPRFDATKIVESEVTLAVQVNGKLRDTITVAADITEADAKAEALKSEKVQKRLEGKEPKKVIYVKGKLISIVV